MTEQRIVPTVPEDWREPAWIKLPKYTRRELAWLCERLDHSNQELRQNLFHLREQLARPDRQENTRGR